MTRPDLFTEAAAQRHADAYNRGERTLREVQLDVRDWFAAVYGWPLNEVEADEYRRFWLDVQSRVIL